MQTSAEFKNHRLSGINSRTYIAFRRPRPGRSQNHQAANNFPNGTTISPKITLLRRKNKTTTCHLYTIKIFKKEFLVENDEIEDTRREKSIFLITNKDSHPFLPKLYGCFQTETHLYFVMEHVPGGDLMFHIQWAPFTALRAR